MINFLVRLRQSVKVVFQTVIMISFQARFHANFVLNKS